MNTDESAGGARREHVRTDDNIPVYYELCSGEGQSETYLDWEERFEDLEPAPEENPKLYALLFEINQKLNILTGQLSNDGSFRIPEARDVNISGGGMRFRAQEPFKEGDLLILKTFLPTYAQMISVKGKVLRSVQCDGGYEVAVEYVDMDEGTREKIIRYIFARQRKDLRKVKGEGH